MTKVGVLTNIAHVLYIWLILVFSVPDVIPSFKYKIVPTTESESQEAEESISVDEATAEQSSSPQKTATDDRSSETSATEESPEPAVDSEQTSTTTSASIASTGANLAIGQLRYLADLLKFEVSIIELIDYIIHITCPEC